MLLTSSWRSLASSSLRVQGAPLSHPAVPPWRSPVPPRRSRDLPPITLQRAPPHSSRALPPRPPPRPLVMGVGDSTSRGRPLSLSSSSSDDDEFVGVVEGGVPAARAAGTPRPAAPGALVARFSSPSRVLPAPVPAAARRGRPLGPGASADLTARRPLLPSAKDNH
jgi:hypothetical protein